MWCDVMWCDVMSESIMIIPASPMFHVSDRTFTMVSFIETQLARSLDGVLSFFEQESFAFSRMITSSFLCGPPRMTGAELGSRGGKSSSEWKGLKSNPNMPTSSKVLIWCVMMMKWCHTMSYDVIRCHMMSCSGCLDQFATCQRSTVLSFVPWTCSGSVGRQPQLGSQALLCNWGTNAMCIEAYRYQAAPCWSPGMGQWIMYIYICI